MRCLQFVSALIKTPALAPAPLNHARCLCNMPQGCDSDVQGVGKVGAASRMNGMQPLPPAPLHLSWCQQRGTCCLHCARAAVKLAPQRLQLPRRYAQTGPNNWPAQLQICGDPPGSSNCASTSYDPNGPFLEPDSVVYDGLTYTGAQPWAGACWAGSAIGRRPLAPVASALGWEVGGSAPGRRARRELTPTMPCPRLFCSLRSNLHVPGLPCMDPAAAHHIPM